MDTGDPVVVLGTVEPDGSAEGRSPRRERMLAVGILALEFAAASQTFIANTLLPTIIQDLSAHTSYSLVVVGPTIGTFVALPLAPRLLRRYGTRPVLATSVVVYAVGATVTAAAPTPAVFAVGRTLQGLGSGLIAVLGLTLIISSFAPRLRARMISLTSLMWVLPATFGPALAVSLNELWGWRLALVTLVPIVLVGRILVGAASAVLAEKDPDSARTYPILTAFLLPAGMALFVAGTSAPGPLVWLAPVGGAMAVAAAYVLYPVGTFRARPGAPAAILTLSVLALAYFGANGLLTSLMVNGLDVPIAAAGVALSAGAIAWPLSSLAQPRLLGGGQARLRTVTLSGLGVMGFALGGVVVAVVTAPHGWQVQSLIVLWLISGLGMGLAYPGIYLACSMGVAGESTANLAAAIIIAESLGASLGLAAGGGLVSGAIRAGYTERLGLTAAYVFFAAMMIIALVLGKRITAPSGIPDRTGE